MKKKLILTAAQLKMLNEINVVGKMSPEELKNNSLKPGKFDIKNYKPSDKSHGEMDYLRKNNDAIRGAEAGKHAPMADMVPQDKIDTLKNVGASNDLERKKEGNARQAVWRTIQDIGDEGLNFQFAFAKAFSLFKKMCQEQGIEVNINTDKEFIISKIKKYEENPDGFTGTAINDFYGDRNKNWKSQYHENRLVNLKERSQLIKESFKDTFNKIRRIDEDYLDEPDYPDDPMINFDEFTLSADKMIMKYWNMPTAQFLMRDNAEEDGGFDDCIIVNYDNEAGDEFQFYLSDEEVLSIRNVLVKLFSKGDVIHAYQIKAISKEAYDMLCNLIENHNSNNPEPSRNNRPEDERGIDNYLDRKSGYSSGNYDNYQGDY